MRRVGRGQLGRKVGTKCSGLRETQVERLVSDEAAEEQVSVVVEPVEELELIETQQHLSYICLSCMRQGAASKCSEYSSQQPSEDSKSSELV